ncbi:MAG TPA: HEAT repeat domain-containing protein [Gemmatimonadaceae bacterium]|nr:HEAT repeat domain-containing protein [Gemmatimonadaceae bacterium]
MCPWNEKFALPVREGAFRPRRAIAGKDASALARELLAMSDEEFRIAFRGSPMKRAKLRGLKRNSTVVLGNVPSREDVDLLVSALADEEPLTRSHAAWALARIGLSEVAPHLRDRLDGEADVSVREALLEALAQLAA